MPAFNPKPRALPVSYEIHEVKGPPCECGRDHAEMDGVETRLPLAVSFYVWAVGLLPAFGIALHPIVHGLCAIFGWSCPL